MGFCFPPFDFLPLGSVAAVPVAVVVAAAAAAAAVETVPAKKRPRWLVQLARKVAGLEPEPGFAVAPGAVEEQAVDSYIEPKWTPCRVAEVGIVADTAVAVVVAAVVEIAVAHIRLAASGPSEASGVLEKLAFASVLEPDLVPGTVVRARIVVEVPVAAAAGEFHPWPG